MLSVLDEESLLQTLNLVDTSRKFVALFWWGMEMMRTSVHIAGCRR